MGTKRKIAGHKILKPDTVFIDWAALRVYAEFPDGGALLDIGSFTAKPGERLADVLAGIAASRNKHLALYATEPLAR
jgi:hypothetical protein